MAPDVCGARDIHAAREPEPSLSDGEVSLPYGIRAEEALLLQRSGFAWTSAGLASPTAPAPSPAMIEAALSQASIATSSASVCVCVCIYYSQLTVRGGLISHTTQPIARRGHRLSGAHLNKSKQPQNTQNTCLLLHYNTTQPRWPCLPPPPTRHYIPRETLDG